MNNETAPILDILEELKQECKAIKKSQAELRIALVEQQNTKPQDAVQIPKAVHLQLSQETKAKIKEHQLFVLAALEESYKKLDPKFEVLQKLLSEQQKPVVFKNYLLFASVRLAERILLSLVCGLVMVSFWFFAMLMNFKPPLTTTSVTAICVCKAKSLPQTLLILTVCLFRIAIQNPSIS